MTDAETIAADHEDIKLSAWRRITPTASPATILDAGETICRIHFERSVGRPARRGHPTFERYLRAWAVGDFLHDDRLRAIWRAKYPYEPLSPGLPAGMSTWMP